MFTIQCLDHEEGTAARWFELANTRHETRDEARAQLRRIRATDSDECLCAYRVVEVGSDAYYSQPTDAYEW